MCSCSGNCNCNSTTIPRGPQGQTGAAGAAATIAVGDVTTGTPAAVTNSGTSSAAIFDFTIPPGSAGPQGTPGSVWYNGSVAPTTLYNNGDYYINTANGDIYQQVSNSWGSPIGNIEGPPGPSFGTRQFSYSAGTLGCPSGPNNIIAPADATFAADTMCPNNGDSGRITGSFFCWGIANTDPDRKFNLDFYIGKSGVGAVRIDPVPSASSSIDNGVYIRNIEVRNTNEMIFVNYVINIYRLSATTSTITVDWKISGYNYPAGTQHSAFYVGSSSTTGGLDFQLGSFVEFKVVADIAVGVGAPSVMRFAGRNLLVEKIIS
jgi:hypothetical protein